MFRHPPWAVGSYSSSPSAAGTVGTKSMGGVYQADVSPCRERALTQMEPTLRGRTPHLLLYFPGYLAGCSLPPSASASIPSVVPPAAAFLRFIKSSIHDCQESGLNGGGGAHAVVAPLPVLEAAAAGRKRGSDCLLRICYLLHLLLDAGPTDGSSEHS